MMKHLQTNFIWAERSKLYFSTWITGDAEALEIASIIRIDTGNAGIQINLEEKHLHALKAAIDEHLENIRTIEQDLAALQADTQMEVQP